MQTQSRTEPWQSLDSYISSAVLLDEQGTILYTNTPWRRFMQQNGGDPRACGTGVNYLRVCQSVEGADQNLSSIVASGIRAVISGQRDWFEANYPCHSHTEQRWFRMRVEPFTDESGARVLILHSPVAPSGIIRHGASSGAELLAALDSFKTMLYRQPDPFTPEQILLLRRIESALLETLNLTKSRLT